MSEKRKIDDADLTEIAGAGELVSSQDDGLKPIVDPPDADIPEPDTDDQNTGNQELGR